ncbi:Chromate resistance protein ChrB [Streptomyces sp. GZWMJZ-114]|uniref:Chromate resistance protein ChrB n=1 Tax=Streptomyces sp. GZWMJZ-114 TaxID=2494734 RepID=UPI001013B317|nr:Chromate resistance protein ChrB [Streptomyces sp. GZWMJZ-114]
MSESVTWLLLAYRIPSEPSRLRATVWRRLKALGAIYVQNSVAALPEDSAAERALRALRAEIGQLGGTAQLLRADALVGGADLVSSYNAARDEEYTEIASRCRDFLAEIDKETAEQHFTYSELEENDEDLTKLRSWFDKVTARDRLGASGRDTTAKALEDCTAALNVFADAVYAADTDGA